MPEKILTLIVLVLTAVAALFCVIGLSTKGWIQILNMDFNLFAENLPMAPKALSVLSFILLLVALATLVLQLVGLLRDRLQLIPIVILFIVTIFLLGTIAGATESAFGYSFDLMIEERRKKSD